MASATTPFGLAVRRSDQANWPAGTMNIAVATRNRLVASGGPYIIANYPSEMPFSGRNSLENVVDAPSKSATGSGYTSAN